MCRSYQISISCFLIDVKYLSKFFEILFNQSSYFFRSSSSQNLIKHEIPIISTFEVFNFQIPIFKFSIFKVSSFQVSKFQIFKFPKSQISKCQKVRCMGLPKCSFLDSHIYKNNIFKNVPIFSCIC